MYGKVNGKQLKDSTVDLLKLDLSGSQGTFLFATGSYLGAYEVPNIPQAFITKQYADSLSSGLDPKESVYLVAVGNITPNGTTVSVDGVTASLGKRILLAGQSSAVDNGIYVVGAGTWSRADDSNGDPSNEVSLGNYTFVERGTTFSSTGWVLYDTNATGATVSPGVETQLWTQFNGAGNFIWGNGLTNIGNTINIDLSPNGGLTFSSTQLTLANYVAGNGLTLTNGILDVGAGTGISVAADSISITNTGVAAGSYGAPGSINTISVNAQGQLTSVATQSISITSGQVSNFTASVQGLATQVIAGTGINVSSVGGYATVSIANTTVNANTYGAADTVPSVTFNAQGQAIAATAVSISITSGQVNNFTSSVSGLVKAGTGITVTSGSGGSTVSITDTGVAAGSYGSAGSVNTFSVNAQGQLTTVATQSISITSGQVSNFTASVQGLATQVIAGTGINVSSVGGYATVSIANTTVTANTYGAADTVPSVTFNAQGQAIAATALSISITSGQVNNFTSSVSGLVKAGSGIIVTSGSGGATVSVNLVKGVTFSGNGLFSDAGTILTTSILPITNIATNSTVQSALSAIDSYLSNVGSQTEISIANSPTGTFVKTVNAPVNALGYTFSTASDGAPHVYINGVYVKTNSSTSSSPAYFSTDGGVNGTTTVGTSSVLYLNPFILGFKLDPTDDIVVHYLTKTF